MTCRCSALPALRLLLLLLLEAACSCTARIAACITIPSADAVVVAHLGLSQHHKPVVVVIIDVNDVARTASYTSRCMRAGSRLDWCLCLALPVARILHGAINVNVNTAVSIAPICEIR